MRRVTFEKLTLRGFAGLPDEASVSLPHGLGVVWGPNEHGKSSLAAGLAAVLFGLPASSDPREFGAARYRSWTAGRHFDGVLEVCADETRWSITRDFDTHRVRVSTVDGERMIDAVHNPAARRRNERYEAFLTDLLGFHSRELFLRTFLVSQPLPAEGALDGEVQQLLSGAEGCRSALEALTAELRLRTVRTGELGATPRNGRGDGALERLRADIAELRSRLAHEREAVDASNAVSAALASCSRELGDAEGRRDGAAARLEAWTSWRRYADAWREASRQRADMQKACDEASQAMARARAAALEEARCRAAIEGSADEGGPGVFGPTDVGLEGGGAAPGGAPPPVAATELTECALLDARILRAQALAAVTGRLRREQAGWRRRAAGVGLAWLLACAFVVVALGLRREAGAAAAATIIGLGGLAVLLWALGASVRALVEEQTELRDAGAEPDLPRLVAMRETAAARGRARAARQRDLDTAMARRLAAEEAVHALLAAFGEGATVERLTERRDLAVDRTTEAYRSLVALCAAWPELPPPEEAPDRRRGLAEAAALSDELATLESTCARLGTQRRDYEREADRLHGRGLLNVAAAELDLAELEREETAMSVEVEAIALAHAHLRAATADYQASHRERLERAASRFFGPLGGDPARAVRLDERFAIRVRLGDGREVVPEQLSRGAQDQLYIALRLAIADMLAADRRLPLVLDDPFVTFDDERRATMTRLLQAAAHDRQIVLLTHDRRLLACGQAIDVKERRGEPSNPRA